MKTTTLVLMNFLLGLAFVGTMAVTLPQLCNNSQLSQIQLDKILVR